MIPLTCRRSLRVFLAGSKNRPLILPWGNSSDCLTAANLQAFDRLTFTSADLQAFDGLSLTATGFQTFDGLANTSASLQAFDWLAAAANLQTLDGLSLRP